MRLLGSLLKSFVKRGAMHIVAADGSQNRQTDEVVAASR